MRLSRRVMSLERRAACSGICATCAGRGWPAVKIVNAPDDPDCPVKRADGCPSCGKAWPITWLGLGEAPTVQEVRAFWEGI